MKKIAIPTRNDEVDSHFGQCEQYSIYTIDEDDKIVDMELYVAPNGCGCKSNLAPVLEEKGVSLMLAGNMGMGALNVLQSSDIEVIRGCSGKVKDVIANYLSGQIEDNGESCAHHNHHHGEENHECGHH